MLKLDLLYKNPADIECFVGSTTNAIIFDDPKGTLLCFIDQNKDIGPYLTHLLTYPLTHSLTHSLTH